MEYKVKDGVNLRTCMHDIPTKTKREQLSGAAGLPLGTHWIINWVSFVIETLSH